MTNLLPLQSLLAIALIPLTAWLVSENRRALSASGYARLIVSALALQYAILFLFVLAPWARVVFEGLGAAVAALQASAETGAQLVFGYLAGDEPPFDQTKPQFAFILAFRVLPVILVLSALVRLFYYWGIIQKVVKALAFTLQKTFGIGGPLSLSAAANFVLGMVEAPLLIRPYLSGMGRGALLATMAVGMATVAGTVLALYATVLSGTIEGSAGHIIAASLINIPGALMLSRLTLPEGFTEGPEELEIAIENPPQSSMDAIAQGAIDGIQIVAAVAAMLIVMVALVALVNSVLAIAGPVGGELITLERILGIICAPIAFAIGIPWSEALTAGSLIGQKVVLNEFLAYLQLAQLIAENPEALSDRSRLLLTYALCGFANLGSLGILIGGLSAMAPERRSEIVELAPRAMLIGFLATLLTAAIVGTTVWS